MKKALFIMAFLMVCGVAQAQCVGNVVDARKSQDGKTIFIEAQFLLNGVQWGVNDIASFSPSEFFGLNKAQALAIIQNKVDQRCEQIIRSNYKKANGAEPKEEALILSVKDIMPKLILIKDDVLNITTSKTEYIEQVDTNGDLENDQTWTIKADGTKSIANITP